MCDAATATILQGVLEGGGSYLGGQSAADAAQYGADKQADLARWMYNEDTNKDIAAANYLTPFLPTLPSGKDYFSPDKVNQFYDKNTANLNFNMGSQVADAQSSAAALAASRGFANPSGFVSSAGQNVRTSFAPQFGLNEANRSQSLMANQDKLYNADFQKLLTEYLNRYNLTNQFGVAGQNKKTYYPSESFTRTFSGMLPEDHKWG